VNKNIASTVATKYRIRGPPHGFRVAQVNDDLSSPAQGDHGVVRRQTRSDRAPDRTRAASHYGNTPIAVSVGGH
jgi:hypothetical protein